MVKKVLRKKKSTRQRKVNKAQNKMMKSEQKVMKKEGAFEKIGSAAGSFFGFPGVGRYLGRGVDYVFGNGDYKTNSHQIKTNSLVTGRTPPQFGGVGRDFIMSRREYLMDIQSGPTLVNGLTAFNSQTFNVNPGLQATFPWGSLNAANFEEYELLGLLFEFKSTSADALNSTNTALGTVIMSTQYNAGNPAFTSKIGQENSEFAQSCKPSESCIHFVECARNRKVFETEFLRSSAVPAGQDIKTYDLGVFQISTQGMQAANVNIGELWVSYHVALKVPRLALATTGFDADDFPAYSYTNATNPLGLGSINYQPSASSTLGTYVNQSTQRLLFPTYISGGQYKVDVWWSGTVSTANIAYPALTLNNCSLITQVQAPTSGDTAKSCSLSVLITISGPGAYIAFGGAGTLPTGTPVVGIDVCPWGPANIATS